MTTPHHQSGAATPPIILASTSPRRRELLAQLGVQFRVIAPICDEAVHPNETPEMYVQRVAIAKAESIAVQHPNAIVIGSDTSVIFEGEIFGKPESSEHAVAMLTRLRGRTHTVFTAVAVYNPRTTRICCELAHTQVTFAYVSDDEIRALVATGEPMDKAGAYAIQSMGGKLVASFDGEYETIVGLSLVVTTALLRQCGIAWPPSSSET